MPSASQLPCHPNACAAYHAAAKHPCLEEVRLLCTDVPAERSDDMREVSFDQNSGESVDSPARGGALTVLLPACPARHRHSIVDEQQERLLGPDGALHPAEYTITELALVETTNDDPTKWQARPTRSQFIIGRVPSRASHRTLHTPSQQVAVACPDELRGSERATQAVCRARQNVSD